MSVLVGDRSESGLEFLKTARDIEEKFIKIEINKPKRYGRYLSKLVDYSMDLLSEVKAGNSIYPSTKLDADTRQVHFREGIGLCQVLVSQVEVVHDLFGNDGISTGEVHEIAEMIDKEIRLIKGIISADKERYKNL